MKNLLKQLGEAACYYLLFLGVQVGVTYAIILGLSNPRLQTIEAITISSGCLTVFILWIFFRIRKKKLFQEVGIKAYAKKYTSDLILLGIALGLVISFGFALLPENLVGAYSLQSELQIGGLTVMLIISDVIITPVVEEIVFRGLILSRLRKAMPLTLAIMITSLVFGLAHGQGLWAAYTFVLSAIFCAVVVKTESITASILMHVIFNLLGTVLPILCQNIMSVVLCTIVVVVAAVAVVILLWKIFKKK